MIKPKKCNLTQPCQRADILELLDGSSLKAFKKADCVSTTMFFTNLKTREVCRSRTLARAARKPSLCRTYGKAEGEILETASA
jgi:hypothetical protein